MKCMLRLILVIIFLIGSWTLMVSKTEVFFSPDDQPTQKLIGLISHARFKIYAAIYMITDQGIAQALIDAKKRGVDVKIIVDTSSVNSPYGKGNLLKQCNIDIFVFCPPSKGRIHRSYKKSYFMPLMHNKFALIDNQLWTGSFNWTKLANTKNQENVIVTDNKSVYEKFEKHFHILKGRCRHYGIASKTEKILPVKVTEPELSGWKSYFYVFKETASNFLNEIKQSIEYVMSHA